MDFNSNKPIYRQIIDFCFNLILTGQWKPGERIPSVRELSVELAVNSRTVMNAFESLEADNIIYSRRGLGFFLSDDAFSLVAEARRKEFFETTVAGMFHDMKLLNISIDEVVEEYRRRNSR